jgi:hypothetical protein
MRVRLVLGVAIVLAMGCGGKKFVPVSGKVTLNKQPLAGATVTFQPIAEKGVEAGPAASGKTNDQGEYSLESITGDHGALPAKYNVTIQALDPKAGDGDTRRRGGPTTPDKVPVKYALGMPQALKFEVPPGGTDKANFDLTSP